jgi:hypothetical protein
MIVACTDRQGLLDCVYRDNSRVENETERWGTKMGKLYRIPADIRYHRLDYTDFVRKISYRCCDPLD